MLYQYEFVPEYREPRVWFFRYRLVGRAVLVMDAKGQGDKAAWV